MTLTKLLMLAYYGAGTLNFATEEDRAKIWEFARTWRDLGEHELEDIRLSLEDMPHADVVEIVRCKDCENNDHGRCRIF